MKYVKHTLVAKPQTLDERKKWNKRILAIPHPDDPRVFQWLHIGSQRIDQRSHKGMHNYTDNIERISTDT